jgi:pimeloyl-ACP methyl ester carboxylesterase
VLDGARATVGGLTREAVSLGVTAALWPFGFTDRGAEEIRRMVGSSSPTVPTPVLLVHGFAANKSNWMFLQRDLRAAGFGHVHALNYNALTATIPQIAAACTARARDLMTATGTDRVHLVGHSLGGIVARYAVQVGGLTEAATCITVASPHQGAPGARVGVSRTIRQLRPGSEVLRRMAAAGPPGSTRFVAYWSNLDLLVAGHRARIVEPALRAANVCIRDEGHVSILLSRRLVASVLHELGAAEGLPGYGSPIAGLRHAA